MVQNNVRLLIVDDDRRFAQELKVDAERLGLAVEVVHEPIAFGPVLTSWKPDIIAMDLVMPEMGGSELAARVREMQPDARILFTSGYTEDAVVRQSLVDPDESFIEKPFTPATLAKKAREVLDSSNGG